MRLEQLLTERMERKIYDIKLTEQEIEGQGELPGLEGPFRFKTGRILYYDPREGKYYDRRSDIYLSHEDADYATGAREHPIHESSAPGQEAWIKSNKAKFIKEYGKKKGMEVLYATAWKRAKDK